MRAIILNICWFVIFIFTTRTATGQDQNLIATISFQGNQRTHSAYLKRFLEHREGTYVNVDLLDRELQTLRNLPTIAQTEVQIDTTDQGLILNYRITEALSLFPIVYFGGVRDNFWFQLGFTDINWRGRGNHLSLSYRNTDRRLNGNFYLRLPYLNGTRWGVSWSASRFASVEPLFFPEGEVRYRYDNHNVGASLIRELSVNHFIELGASFFIEDYQKTEDQPLTEPPGPDALTEPKLLIKLKHQLNRRNYHFYQIDGHDVESSVQLVRNLRTDVPFVIALLNYHWFRRYGRTGNLASRLRLGISTNNNTPFAPFVLDSYFNIRGAGNRIDRGTAQVVWNLEYRWAVWDQARFAGQVVAFSDVGVWRSPGGAFDELLQFNSRQHFAGLGIRFIYKKAFDAIVRIDYGVDLLRNERRGFVVGLGQYF